MEIINKRGGSTKGSEIVELGKSMGLRVKVYRYDKLPKRLTGNNVILLGDNVGHWVAVFAMKHTVAYYDSFGVPPPNEIYKSVGKRILFFSIDEDQRRNMNHCGQLCLYWLYRMNSLKTGIKA